MTKNISVLFSKPTSQQATHLLLAMQKSIETKLNPDHPYDDKLSDLFAGFLHLNGETRLFVDPIEQSLFDQLFYMPEEQFNELFMFCLNYFYSPIDDIAEYFGISENEESVARLEHSSVVRLVPEVKI